MNIAAQSLQKIVQAFLENAGSSADEALCVAEHLVQANLKGHDSHGVGMLVQYAKSIQEGLLKPNTAARLINDAGAVLQFSGDRGYGQRTGKEAMAAAIERAKQTGVCLMTLAKTNHLGRIGTYGEQAAAAGMISVHFVNVTDFNAALVAPFCGSAARFGTNPICIAMPKSPENPAFILDFATSIVALGKTRVAYLAGKKFDEEVMLDAKGHPTNDPKAMWEEPTGALRPIAKHKGGGLIMACEFLAGLLSGGGTFQPENPREGAIVNNMTTFVVDPTKLAAKDWFGAEYDAMIDYIRSSPAPFPDEHPILISGEPEIRTAAQRLANGIDISDNEWQAITDAGVALGMRQASFSY
ncbi:malate/lactate/ureidoglycolate dehydrogenase [Neisseria sp. Ec49-e6-T10]|uniref:malate/lactate/ureidoglycolate dehydrogenase n=1 Tax=Neisseria sp. Ec49-e6-T10 TaxID=3140744 RepID=UPI003EB8D2AE